MQAIGQMVDVISINQLYKVKSQGHIICISVVAVLGPREFIMETTHV